MRVIRGWFLVLGLVIGIMLGTPVALSGVDAAIATAALGLFVEDAAAQDQVVCAAAGSGAPAANLCRISDDEPTAGDGGDGAAGGGAGDGGNGGRGGFITAVHDIANAHADASSSVVIDDITTGDAIAPDISVDASGATRPVVVAVAGSFVDTGVDIFAPGGGAQAGTTGGNGIGADSSGGDGGAGGDGGIGQGGGPGGDSNIRDEISLD